MSDEMMSVAEVARLLGLSDRTVHKKVREGRIGGAFDVAGITRFRKSEFLAWLESQRVPLIECAQVAEMAPEPAVAGKEV